MLTNAKKYDTIYVGFEKHGMFMAKNNKLFQQKPKIVLFDLGSMILDYKRVNLDTINQILSDYNTSVLLDAKKYKNSYKLKKSLRQIYEKEDAKILLNNIKKLPLLNDNIVKTLEYCRKEGIKTAIVGKKDNKTTKQFLDALNLTKYFDDIITPQNNKNVDDKVLSSYLKQNNIDTKKDTVLFMGDNFNVVKNSFRTGCIPVIYKKTAKKKNLWKYMKRLSKMRSLQTIRYVNSQNDFIKLMQKSKKARLDKKVTKITYIGGSGKIGQSAINMICSQVPNGKKVELVLIGSGDPESLTRLEGLIKDVKGGLELLGRKSKIKFTITNDYSKTEGSKVAICSAGKWPTPEQKAIFKKRDPSGRSPQSIVNADMIASISKNLNKYCPDALYLMVTNQVDTMCHIARQTAPNMKNILGLSGAVDSSRLRQSIRDTMNIDGAKGYMIGAHNDNMLPIIQSVKTKNNKKIFESLIKNIKSKKTHLIDQEFQSLEQQNFETVLSATRKMGKLISDEQKAGLKNCKEATEATLLPATAITRVVNSYCFGKDKHIESYNTIILDPKVASHYGVTPGTEISIPLSIKKGKIQQKANIPLLQTEKLAIKRILQKNREDLNIVLNENKGLSL